MNLAGFPVIVLELALVVVGLVGFGWWQLRDLAKVRRDTQARRNPGGRNEGPEP
jgi:hypothetical protein